MATQKPQTNPQDDYDQIPGVRWSRLKSMRVSPKQYLHDTQHERDDAAHFRIGHATHAFALDPDQFEKTHVCYRGRRAGKDWEAFKKQHRDLEILNLTEWEKALGCACAVTTHAVASGYLQGLVEHPITWIDEVTGLECKGRPDVVARHNGVADLVDLKTTASLAPRLFANATARLGYHCQLAFYCDGLRANGTKVSDEPIIVAVESSSPHDVIVYRVCQAAIELGRNEYRELLRTLKKCKELGEWPGMAQDDVVDLDLPAWCYDGLELTSGGERMDF